MSIRRLLQVFAIVTTVVVAGCVALLVILSGRATESQDALSLVSDIRNDLGDVALLTGELAAGHSASAHARWDEALDSLDSRLALLPKMTGMTGVLLGRVEDNVATMRVLTGQMGSLHGSGEVGPLDEATAATEALLVERTVVAVADSRGAADAASRRIRQSAFADADVLRTVFWINQGLLVALVGLVIMTMWRSVLRPISVLSLGVERVGRGDLDQRVGIDSRSEVGALSVAFDQMTQNLQQTTVSRDALEREVDRRVKAEAAQAATMEDLRRSNRDLEEFAYVASHDLQEPLRMVASYTQLLEKRYSDMLDDRARKYIDYAVDGANRMHVLINDLLAYSRVNTKGEAPVWVEAQDALDKALFNLRTAIAESSATVSSGPLPRVRGDVVQIAQLFQNLISNALKFRKDIPPQIRISAEETNSDWVFAVEDNGIGMDPIYSDKIFKVFQRLHTSSEYPGTGIGLAICKRIAERHGGGIWFESEPGVGTTFYFTIAPSGGG